MAVRRLTPDKIHGYKLPDKARRINRGNTSIIYTCDDPDQLDVFTIEPLKLEWWKDGLHITDHFEYVCDASYSGFLEPHNPNRCYPRHMAYIQMPVYYCRVRRLEMPTTQPAKLIIYRLRKQIVNAIQNKHAGMTFEEWWNPTERWYRIRDQVDSAHVRAIAEFALCRDSNRINPDFGPGDWAMLNGGVCCIDPYHHEDLRKAFLLHN